MLPIQSLFAWCIAQRVVYGRLRGQTCCDQFSIKQEKCTEISNSVRNYIAVFVSSFNQFQMLSTHSKAIYWVNIHTHFVYNCKMEIHTWCIDQKAEGKTRCSSSKNTSCTIYNKPWCAIKLNLLHLIMDCAAWYLISALKAGRSQEETFIGTCIHVYTPDDKVDVSKLSKNISAR